METNIWAKPATLDDTFSKLGSMPVRFGSQMKQSTFSDEYFRELTFQHVESINLLYVALTRAQEELYAFTNIQKRENYNIGKLLWDSTLAITEDTIADGTNYIEFGEQLPPEPPKESDKKRAVQNILLNSYPTTQPQLALRLTNQRYFEDDKPQTSNTPRTLGITMHSILSQAKDANEIKQRIEAAHIQGELNLKQANEITTAIEREFQRPQVQEWFGEWDNVYCEQDIIGDHTIGTRRPDRVMVRHEQAIVVDYKFGEEMSKSHRDQIRKYTNLLGKMGYTQIEGYVWYINLGKIIRINSDDSYTTID